MKSLIYLFLSIFLITNLNSKCTPSDTDDSICYEFDQRQCSGDEWSNEVPLDASKAEREEKIKSYLMGKDIEIKKVLLVADFHDAVCKACFVCPEEGRFFVRFDENDLAKLEQLDLLNFAKVDCEEVF